MNTLVPIVDNSLMAKSDDDLLAVLSSAMTLIASELVKMSQAWGELERRGHDMSAMKVGFKKNLPLIASGRLAAEAVVAFSGKPIVLRVLDGVPLDVQRRLADGEQIPVYFPEEKIVKALPLSRIPPVAVPGIIQDGIVLTPSEQRLARRERQESKHRPEAGTPRKYAATVDKDARTLKIGKVTVPIATILAAMAEAAGARGEIIDTVEAPAKTVGGKLTDEERDRLRAACKAHNITEQEAVRRAIVAMWML